MRAALLSLAIGLAALPVAGTALAPMAAAGERGSWLDERGGYATPLLFRAANGGAFRPHAVVVMGAGAATAARLPEAADAAPEDRMDLSGVPVLGPLFRPTLDVASAREGTPVGPVYRVGDRLVIDVRTGAADATGRPVAIATNVPRYGAISYRLGRLDWQPTAAPAITGEPIGSAHILGGTLVLASQGGEPAWPSLEALLEDLF